MIILLVVFASTVWSFVGIASAFDPRDSDRSTCKIDRTAVMCLSIIAIIQICCCQCFTMGDLHQLEKTRHRRAANPSSPNATPSAAVIGARGVVFEEDV